MGFLEKIKNLVQSKELIKNGENIGVAVSGGADSMCLLYVFFVLKKHMDFELSVLHFEHGIRGEDSLKDAKFVEEICSFLRVPFIKESGNVPGIAEDKKISLETAAREARYAFFERATMNHSLDKVALAHHMDDQAETVILNLVRGSGIRGLSGMKEFREPNYIRPMLCVCKDEIVEYVKDNNIPFIHDETNDSMNYTRNRLRHIAMKNLSDINENAVSNIVRTASVLRDDESFLSLKTEEEFKERVRFKAGEVFINLKKWDKVHIAIKRRVIRKAIESYFSLIDVEFIHIEYIINVTKGESGKRTKIAGNVNASKAYENLILYTEKEEERIFRILELNDVQSFTISGFEFATSICEEAKFEEDSESFDFGKLKRPVFRNPESEDYIYPLGLNGKKRLTDYLSDKKIPLHQREKLLLLADNEEIIWVVGFGISENFKVDKDTKKVFRIRYKKLNS